MILYETHKIRTFISIKKDYIYILFYSIKFSVIVNIDVSATAMTKSIRLGLKRERETGDESRRTNISERRREGRSAGGFSGTGAMIFVLFTGRLMRVCGPPKFAARSIGLY